HAGSHGVEFASLSVAIQYLMVSALLTAFTGLPVCLTVWVAARGWRSEHRTRSESVALIAVQMTAILLPLAIRGLLYLHKTYFANVSGSLEAIGTTALALLGFALLAIALTRLASRLRMPDLRDLAPAGYAFAALFSLAFLVWSAAGRAAPGLARPNLLVISIDSLRRDVFEEYVERFASPTLRRFVTEGMSFRNAHTTYTHSLASHASIFTGLYPPEHGAMTSKSSEGATVWSELRPGTRTLAEILAGEGYETVAVESNPWLGTPFGLDVGYEAFVHYGVVQRLGDFHPSLALDASLIGPYLRYVDFRFGRKRHTNSGIFLSWLRSRYPSRPFFAFLHYIEMHTPNDPPAEYRRRFTSGRFADLDGMEMFIRVEDAELSESDMPEVREHLRNLHLAELARMDEILTPVLRELLEGGWLSNTLVFLVSDHGENLYEKGGTYSKSHVYHTSSEIPFVVRVPGEREGSRRDDLASLVDIPSTFLEYSNLPAPENLQGISLLSGSRTAGSGDWIYLQGWDRPNSGHARAVIFADEQKWIRDGVAGEELYDLAADPEELEELASARSEAAKRYRDRFEEIVAGMEPEEERSQGVGNLSPAVSERLRAMGYLR
ncbi:MAG: sulfatase, partial [Myxococcota bacterium]